jgi:hypothetical protein
VHAGTRIYIPAVTVEIRQAHPSPPKTWAFLLPVKLTTLKPRLSPIGTSRVPTLQHVRPGIVERKRGSAGVKDRDAIKQRDCHMCQSCGRLGRVVDHIVPLWACGSDDESNKQLLCDDCHKEKSALEAKQRAGGGVFFGAFPVGHRAPSHSDKKSRISK